LKEALRNLSHLLQQQSKRLPTKVVTPLASNYRPELDVSPLLNHADHTLYMQLVGILCWAVEVGRIDIHLPVALMAQYLAQPRIGHLVQIYHIFAYIQAHLMLRYPILTLIVSLLWTGMLFILLPKKLCP
jgi:hypothetical protein